MPIGISGGRAELRRFAMQLRLAENRELREELRRANRQAARPLEKKVKANAAAMLPKRHGYAAIMGKAVKVTILTGLQGGINLTAHIYARGKVEHRDVVAVNAGRLRHPLFGRRKYWFITQVLPGFVTKAVNDIPDEMGDEILAAVDRVLNRLARG